MAGHFSSLLAGADLPDARRVPVTVLTGFLGSGKTTLLNRLLQQPDLEGTAVIVNEFGEVGIDADLITQATDDTVLLANGCLCCAVRGDLVEALLRLAERSAADRAPLRQVLIETSGLADPGPILRTLYGEPGIRRQYRLAGVGCTVDAVLGMGTLDRHREAVEQVAVADQIYLTKTDLLDTAPPQALIERLAALNPGAELIIDPQARHAALHRLMQSRDDTALEVTRRAAGDEALYYRPGSTAQQVAPAVHRDGITSFALVREEPLPRDGFFAWLDMVIAMRGEDLLRVKGIVNLAEQPEQPLVFHGVQHLFHPPESLPAWPGADRRTRIVFITRGLDGQALDETLRVFERRHRRRGATATPRANPSSSSSETP